jgi:hypothetical protein
MRRVARNDDTGVASLVVVLAMVLILGVTAVALDGGAAIAAKRSVQNSADAAALAVATDCARKAACPSSTATYLRSGETADTPVIDSGAGTVTVTVSKVVDFNFAPIIGLSNGTVHRSATAKWGTLGSADTIPITISNCEFSQALLDGTTNIILYLDDPKPQSGCSSLPGGFSQLRTDSQCVTSGGTTVDGDPGGDLQKVVPCITPLPHDVLVPMYDAAACQAAGCNGHGPYTILGYAMFHVVGYSFNGNNYGGTLGKTCPQQGQRGKYCIQGDFIRFVTSQGTPGPSTDFGVVQVSLIK